MPMTRLALATAALLPLLGVATASSQQVPRGSIGTTGFSPPVHGGGAAAPRRPQEPPGLPGSAAKPGETAVGVQTDLAPTEALFDAINRGNVTEARDAVGRGADINGRNALGMTPLDLSIDLSHNDITFLLLSMRSQNAEASSSNDGKIATAVGAAAKATPKLAAARTARPHMAQATTVARGPAMAATASASARYAGSGGAPVPQAGFLGFGGAGQP